MRAQGVINANYTQDLGGTESTGGFSGGRGGEESKEKCMQGNNSAAVLACAAKQLRQRDQAKHELARLERSWKDIFRWWCSMSAYI